MTYISFSSYFHYFNNCTAIVETTFLSACLSLNQAITPPILLAPLSIANLISASISASVSLVGKYDLSISNSALASVHGEMQSMNRHVNALAKAICIPSPN